MYPIVPAKRNQYAHDFRNCVRILQSVDTNSDLDRTHRVVDELLLCGYMLVKHEFTSDLHWPAFQALTDICDATTDPRTPNFLLPNPMDIIELANMFELGKDINIVMHYVFMIHYLCFHR